LQFLDQTVLPDVKLLAPKQAVNISMCSWFRGSYTVYGTDAATIQ